MSIVDALSAIDEQGRAVGKWTVPQALDLARSQARHLEAAVSTVLDFAAWKAGSFRIHPVACSLSDALQHSTLSHLLPTALSTEVEAPEEEQIFADGPRVARALSRLQHFAESCGTDLQFQVQGRRFTLEVVLDTQKLSENGWQALWHQVQQHRSPGRSSSEPVFAASDLPLVAEVFRQHHARFTAGVISVRHRPTRLRFEVQFPEPPRAKAA